MSDYEKMTIVIQNNHEGAGIDISYSDGTMQHKQIPVLSLCRLLSSYGSVFGESLGQIPNGYVNAEYSSNKNYSVVLRSPALSCPVQFMGRVYESIPYPALVFRLKFRAGLLYDSSVWAMNKSGALCRYPFGNVYNDGRGRICWGGYQHQEVFSLKDSEKTVWKFYELPTNNDLWEESNVNHNVGVLSNMYDMLNNKQEFPDEWLVPMDISLDNLLGGLKNE